jgi:hypothetical protein
LETDPNIVYMHNSVLQLCLQIVLLVWMAKNMSNYFGTKTPMLHEYLTSTIWDWIRNRY